MFGITGTFLTQNVQLCLLQFALWRSAPSSSCGALSVCLPPTTPTSLHRSYLGWKNLQHDCAKSKCIKIFMTNRCRSPPYHCSMFHLQTSTWIGPGECWFMLRLPPNHSEQLWVQWEKVRRAGIPVWEEGPRDLQPFIGPGIPACAVQPIWISNVFI